MNVKDSIKKVGAVAASTLMVGMTMGAAQSLGDFPGMFVDDDGAPTAQVVVGSQGAVSDVVGAVNVAAALGQATVKTAEQTETVDVEGAGSIGWNADSGQTMDTRNDNLFYGDNIDTVRQTLTQDHLDALQSVSFTDDAGNSQDVEFFLYPGSQAIGFGNPGDTSDQDPFLYVNNPSSVNAGSYLYRLQANFGEGLEIDTDTVDDDDGNDDVLGQDIELFGKDFTISQDSFDSNHAGQLVLFGSSQEYDLETGESTDFEVNGNEHTLEVRAVTTSTTVAFYIDGELQEKEEGSTFNVDGTSVRVDDVIQTSSQNSEGLATFSIGSEEFVLEDGQTVQDGDGDDIEGTHVTMSGTNVGGTETLSGDNQIEVSSLTVHVGAADSDDSYVMAGEEFNDPIFSGVNFNFGGLAPDAGDGAGENVGEVEFGTTGDDVVTASFTTDGGDDATIEWAHSPDVTAGSNNLNLANGDGDTIHVTEMSAVQEDEYFTADAGDFAHLWRVTSVDPDTTTAGNIASDDEATVDLRDVATGQTVELDLDAYEGDTTSSSFGDGDEYYRAEEVIDGQTYHFWVGANGNFDEVVATWDSSSDFAQAGDRSVFPAVDLEGGPALAPATWSMVEDGTTVNQTLTYELPSTESSDAKSVDVTYTNPGDGSGIDVDIGGDGNDLTDITATQSDTFMAGQVAYNLSVTNTGSNTAVDVNVGVDTDQDTGTGGAARPGALVLQPEDDNDQEQGYLHVPGLDTSNDEVDAGGSAASVQYTGGAYSPLTLDSNDDMEVSYNVYGTHTMQDTNDQGTFTLHVPDQQSVAGAAFVGAGGSLDMGGTGSSQGEVTYTGVVNEDLRGALPDLAKTDDQVTQSDRSNSHLILVGGPAVNTLVADLADDGETWTTQEWRNQHVDEALLQVVENAFADGQHAMIVAGHSADDTRAAARYISEYASHQDTLEGAMQYSPSSQEAPR